MCECITEINKKLEDLGKNTMLDIPLTWSEKNGALKLDARRVQITTCKRDEKKREKPIPILPSYCPFCGEEYNKEKVEGELTNGN